MIAYAGDETHWKRFKLSGDLPERWCWPGGVPTKPCSASVAATASARSANSVLHSQRHLLWQIIKRI